MVKCILAEQGRGGGGSGGTTSVSPIRLEINTPPEKTQYIEGETFSIDGLTATVYYGVPGSTLVTKTSQVPNDIPYSNLSITPDDALSSTDTKVTISYGAVSANVPIKVRWEWGEDGGPADEAWFNGLNNYLQSNSGSSLRTSSGGEILGTTKSVTLTTSVLDTTTHLIRVIGVDQDADNTVTFQTANCLNSTVVWSTTEFDSTNTTAAMWTEPNCEARAECKNYKKALPGYNASIDVVPYIRIVKKGTCPDTDNSRNGSPIYNNEDVWLLSEREMGLDTNSPLSVANSTASKAECTEGKNFSYAYYTSDESRIKRLGDYGNVDFQWERSRDYDPSYSIAVCEVNIYGWETSAAFNDSAGLAPAFVVGTEPKEYSSLAGEALAGYSKALQEVT